MPIDPSSNSCEGCRWCPTTYPGEGLRANQLDLIPVQRILDFEWVCLRGHDLHTWAEGHESILQLMRKPYDVRCPDREETYRGSRVSRYSREPVI